MVVHLRREEEVISADDGHAESGRSAEAEGVQRVAAAGAWEPEPWSDSLTANPGQRLTVPDSLTALTALSLTV